MSLKPNPKLSAPAKDGPAAGKPPAPSGLDTPESEIDHTRGADGGAYPLEPPKKEAPPEEDTPDIDAPPNQNPLHIAAPLDDVDDYEPPSGGIGAPPSPEQIAAAAAARNRAAQPQGEGNYAGYQDLQKPEEGDPGASKKIRFVRGIAPGTRPTY